MSYHTPVGFKPLLRDDSAEHQIRLAYRMTLPGLHSVWVGCTCRPRLAQVETAAEAWREYRAFHAEQLTGDTTS